VIYQAACLYVSSFANNAHIIRAFLFANATAALLAPTLSFNSLIHLLRLSSFFAETLIAA